MLVLVLIPDTYATYGPAWYHAPCERLFLKLSNRRCYLLVVVPAVTGMSVSVNAKSSLVITGGGLHEILHEIHVCQSPDRVNRGGSRISYGIDRQGRRVHRCRS